eukprot:scaffold167038_cov35-Tisochrysis_lutea.AAC.1
MSNDTESTSSSLVADEWASYKSVAICQDGGSGDDELEARNTATGVDPTVELDARLHQELLSHRLEEHDTILLSADLVKDLHVLVIAIAQPDKNVSHKLEVRFACWRGRGRAKFMRVEDQAPAAPMLPCRALHPRTITATVCGRHLRIRQEHCLQPSHPAFPARPPHRSGQWHAARRPLSLAGGARLTEVLDGDEPRVAQRAHDLFEIAELSI